MNANTQLTYYFCRSVEKQLLFVLETHDSRFLTTIGMNKDYQMQMQNDGGS